MRAEFDQSQDFDVGFEEQTETDVVVEQDHEIEVTFENATIIPVELSQSEEFVCEFDAGASQTGDYDGPYEVTPTASEQTLPTENKTMERNVTVHATPYSEVSNIYGGNTVTIL